MSPLMRYRSPMTEFLPDIARAGEFPMMSGMWVRILLFFSCLGFAPAALAASSADLPHTRVALFAESATPAPGKPLRIAIRMTPKPGWHTYWEHPGDSGMPTRARWTLPPGAAAGQLRYPTPDTFLVDGIMNHVYKGTAVLLADISVPGSASGAFPIALKLDWLVCDDRSCVPESADLDIQLKTGSGTPDPANRVLFADAQAAMPVPLPERGAFALSGDRIRISIPFAGTAGVERAHFFPLGDDMTLFAAPQRVEGTDTALIIDTQPVPGMMTPAEVRGVLRVESGATARGFTVEAAAGPVAAGTPIAPAPRQLGNGGFLSAFGLAVLGGLLLNLMPCVFPILSLKAMSLARAGESERHARIEGIAYAAGVILVCLMLGGAAIALARAGQGAGWAFQLQDPRVILLLMFLTLAIGLNFAGLFEMNAGAMSAGQSLASAPGAKGAFWTGALAAFVATPCTGPFMAGALGAALVLPPIFGLAVFAGLGIGLALPFVAIGFFPALRRRLPKPGAWMQTFRRILAVPMLLTAVALAWVLGRQAGVSGLSLGLLFALLVGLSLWWLGLRQRRAGKRTAPLALLALFAVVAPLMLARLPATAATKAEGAMLSSVPFTPEKLAELQQQRKRIFLYFTADWCLTCKVNEKGALSSARVAEDFRRAGITVMVGDWTKPDPSIAQFLADHGRAGIPLYLYYAPNGDVEELPQLLTVDRLLAVAG